MKIENNKIVEATERELFQHFLNEAYFLLIDYNDFKSQCIKRGTKIIDEKSETDKAHEGVLEKVTKETNTWLEKAMKSSDFEGDEFIEYLKQTLKGDKVEVVRCKDCKYSEVVCYYDGSETRICRVLSAWISTYDDDFCSRGEPKESEEKDNDS